MKLLTKAIKKKIDRYPLYSQENKGKEADVICKFFTPDAQFTWIVLEGEQYGDDYEFFGAVRNYPYDWEYGYFTLSQLRSVRGILGLPVERDLYVRNAKLKDFWKEGE